MENTNNIKAVMSLFAAESGHVLEPERIALWQDMFKSYAQAELVSAAKLLLKKGFYNKFPRVSDFQSALEAVKGETKDQWAIAWDDMKRTLQKYHPIELDKALDELKRINPQALRALGTSAQEFMAIKTEDIPTFRAQFRQRFEAHTENQRAESSKVDALKTLQSISNLKQIGKMPHTE